MVSGQGWAGGPDGEGKRLSPALTELGQGGGSTWCDSQARLTHSPAPGETGALAASSIGATTAQPLRSRTLLPWPTHLSSSFVLWTLHPWNSGHESCFCPSPTVRLEQVTGLGLGFHICKMG